MTESIGKDAGQDISDAVKGIMLAVAIVALVWWVTNPPKHHYAIVTVYDNRMNEVSTDITDADGVHESDGGISYVTCIGGEHKHIQGNSYSVRKLTENESQHIQGEFDTNLTCSGESVAPRTAATQSDWTAGYPNEVSCKAHPDALPRQPASLLTLRMTNVDLPRSNDTRNCPWPRAYLDVLKTKESGITDGAGVGGVWWLYGRFASDSWCV